LADWKLNIGQVLSNMSAFQNDNLVLRYGYIMQTITVDVTHRTTGLQTRPGTWNPSAVVTTFRSERKIRQRATPYGFGLDPKNFSESQWAILGALGMTMAPKILRTY